MMPRIYGNQSVLQLLSTMCRQDRIPHACLIHGEAGLGKKQLARHLAMTALCTGEHAPCGTCSSCYKLLHDVHPDVMWVEHSGKRQGFSVETVRHVCRDAIVAPNDGARKVYIFADCDQMDVRAQNTLLKLTEEPPPHVLLIFTAANKHVFLDTMLSRMMLLAASPVSLEDCRQALEEQDCTAQDAARAVEVCGGNIGKCLQWLHSEEMQKLTSHVAAYTQAIAGRKTYDALLLTVLYEKDRQLGLQFLQLLDAQLRDAIVLKYDPAHPIGCDRTSAASLSHALTLHRCQAMHQAVQESYDAIQANVSLRLVLSALTGRLCSL